MNVNVITIVGCLPTQGRMNFNVYTQNLEGRHKQRACRCTQITSLCRDTNVAEKKEAEGESEEEMCEWCDKPRRWFQACQQK